MADIEIISYETVLTIEEVSEEAIIEVTTEETVIEIETGEGLNQTQVQTLIDANIDAEFSETSEKAVQNKIVKTEFDKYASLVVETFSADYQLQATDSNKLKRCTSAVDVNLTIPADLSLPLPVAIEQAGNGVVTIVAGAGVTVNGDVKTAGQYKYVVIVKVSTNVYTIIGGTS